MLNREKTIIDLNKKYVFDSIGIKINELSFIEKINIRIDPNNKNLISSCGKIIDILLPTKPNTYARNEKIKAIWLGPNEWLITNENKTNLITKLRNEIGDKDGSATDVSENRTIIRISGEKVYILLAKFLTLNLEKNLFNQNACAQTLFVKVPVLLVRNNTNQITNPEIDIFTNRSHSNYIYNLIFDGAKNFNF